jgi:hypothetical protein
MFAERFSGAAVLEEFSLEQSVAVKSSDGLLNPKVAGDVRRLVELHDRGGVTPFESKGASWEVLLDLTRHLQTILNRGGRDGLVGEMTAQAIRFVRSVPAENIFLKFEVTNRRPDVPAYNPAHFCAYDADRSYGADYLSVTRRLTIFGSTSSVMQDHDIGLMLERGKKKCAVLYMGTQKGEDVAFLSPSGQMALDLTVSGIEHGESSDTIRRKVEVLEQFPALESVYAEVADLLVLLAEFHNDLSPDKGGELVDRLEHLSSRIKEISAEIASENEFVSELIADIELAVHEMEFDPTVAEILEMRREDVPVDAEVKTEEGGQEAATELTALIAEVEDVLTQGDLSAAQKQERIIALCSELVPAILKNEALAKDAIVYLAALQKDMALDGITLPSPLMLVEAKWGEKETLQLITVLQALDDPEVLRQIKGALSDRPGGAEILASLDRLQERINVPVEDKAELVLLLQEALSNPSSPENAQIATDVLRVLNLVSDERVQGAVSLDVKEALVSFARETFSAQLDFVRSDLPEKISEATQGIIRPDFPPPVREMLSFLPMVGGTQAIVAKEFPIALTPAAVQQTFASPMVRDAVKEVLQTLPQGEAAVKSFTAIETVLRQEQTGGRVQEKVLALLQGKSPAAIELQKSVQVLTAQILSSPEILQKMPEGTRTVLTALVLQSAAARAFRESDLPRSIQKSLRIAVEKGDTKALARLLLSVESRYAGKDVPPAVKSLLDTVRNLPGSPAGAAEWTPERPIKFNPPANDDKTPMRSQPVPRPVCSRTGTEICLCSAFNDRAGREATPPVRRDMIVLRDGGIEIVPQRPPGPGGSPSTPLRISAEDIPKNPIEVKKDVEKFLPPEPQRKTLELLAVPLEKQEAAPKFNSKDIDWTDPVGNGGSKGFNEDDFDFGDVPDEPEEKVNLTRQRGLNNG